MRLLVTGGAGYIGSHFVAQALHEGYRDIVVVDNLSTGKRERLPARVSYVNLDLSDSDNIEQLVGVLRNNIDAVVHFAAKKAVNESVKHPEEYFRENIGATLNLLTAVREASVMRLVFSSSAAVYGEPVEEIVFENTVCDPINPYGESKLVSEMALANASKAWGLQAIALRYFNVAGAVNSRLADTTTTNLMPAIRDVISSGEKISIFGDDYDSPDGTCIRDYIHILDLVEAHLAALRKLEEYQQPRFETYNVGTGRGTSVLEIVKTFQNLPGIELDYVYAERREGDPAALTANVDKIERDLSWKARFSTTDIIQSVVNHPPILEVNRDHSTC